MRFPPRALALSYLAALSLTVPACDGVEARSGWGEARLGAGDGTERAWVATGVGDASGAHREGPGPLFIVGGGPRPDSIMAHFVELAGGPGRARIAVVPMSSGDPEGAAESLREEMGALGAADVVDLLMSREEAERTGSAERLEGVTGVWFAGGVQTRHTEALRGTPVEAALHELHRSGVVIGGTSAGAAIMSNLMITGAERRPGGDRPSTNGEPFITVDRGNIVTEPGFGFLDDVIIDQHFVRRKRHNRLISLVLEHPGLLGAGIDEGTALVVYPDGRWVVRGESVVVVYDARESAVTDPGTGTVGARDVRMHLLPAGAVYHPSRGVAELP